MNNSTENRLASKTRCMYGMVKTEQTKQKNMRRSAVRRSPGREVAKLEVNVQARPFRKSTRSFVDDLGPP